MYSFGVRLLMVSMGLFWLNSDVIVYQTLCYSTEWVCVFLLLYYLQNQIWKKAAISGRRIYKQTSWYTAVNYVEPTHSHWCQCTLFLWLISLPQAIHQTVMYVRTIWQAPSDSNYWLWLGLPQSQGYFQIIRMSNGVAKYLKIS